MTATLPDWPQVCDALAAELLGAAGLSAPPVDALKVAQRLQVELVWDASQSGRARVQLLGGRPVIFLRPGQRPERTQWAVAHELGELFAWRVAERLDLAPGEWLPRQREEIANALAQRLLLPDAWFAAAHRDCRGDLFALKDTFRTASHELIAWRLLDLEGLRVATVIDGGRVSRRRSNGPDYRAPIHPAEEATWRESHATARTARRSFHGGDVRAWPIHEPGWKREIAVTEWDEL
uniref:ImmA/IrrE family metallo-endopeptidase n=1 Tax=Schlesneria paludicola TaxID=360056 RepID=A0A7C2JX87_9PLAN